VGGELQGPGGISAFTICFLCFFSCSVRVPRRDSILALLSITNVITVDCQRVSLFLPLSFREGTFCRYEQKLMEQTPAGKRLYKRKISLFFITHENNRQPNLRYKYFAYLFFGSSLSKEEIMGMGGVPLFLRQEILKNVKANPPL